MNERRRTLLFSPSKNGVYIESIDHKFYLTNDWDTTNTANSIAVVTDECKFRIALTQKKQFIAMNPNSTDPWDRYLSGTTNSGTTDETVAITDYNGAVNTQLIVTKCQSSTEYAAGWCNAYTFPDGVTKGYLPALGELYLANQNKDAIDAALTKCGGTTIFYAYWSSTFWGSIGGRHFRNCWWFDLSKGSFFYTSIDTVASVRAFGVLEDSN